MTISGVLLADGSSDLPLAAHLEVLCADRGFDVSVTPINPDLLPAGRTVAGRLDNLAQLATYEIVFVHRDAEAQDPELRHAEVADGARRAGLTCPSVAVVPVRMTEAWLLLDEEAIRRVAGRPQSSINLGLPKPKHVEGVADPKALLRAALVTASDTTGRRRQLFQRDFDRHRGLLLERLDPHGPVTALSSWKRLCTNIDEALARL